MLIAFWTSPSSIARSAAESLLVKAFAIPALSMQPEVSSFPITVETPEVVGLTVTLTDVKWLNGDGGALPVTISVNIEGVTEGPRLMFRVEETEPLLGGVRDVVGVVPNNADTPVGTSAKPRLTVEIKPLMELTVTVGAGDSSLQPSPSPRDSSPRIAPARRPTARSACSRSLARRFRSSHSVPCSFSSFPSWLLSRCKVADSPRLSVIGEIGLREKSGPLVGPRLARTVFEQRPLLPPDPVASVLVLMVMSV